MDYFNRKIPDVAALMNHLSVLTGVKCEVAHTPEFKAMGLFSLPTVSEDLVRIGHKYGLNESVTGDLTAWRNQLSRVLNALITQGVVSKNELENFFG